MSLKHDIRQHFDLQSGFCREYPITEGGFVNKIVNLAMGNIMNFTPDTWKLAVARSQKHKFLLYNLSGRQEYILDSEIALIVLEDENVCYSPASIDLLALSLMYAAKYYSIDFNKIDIFDKIGVKQELCRGYGGNVLMLACLGFFNKQQLDLHLNTFHGCESIVKEL